MAENRPVEQPGGNVDYEKLREQYADQKREEQEEEEGDLISVTLNLPGGSTKVLKVCSNVRSIRVHAS